ncbi:aminoglycoside phosphotransferase family protein [Kribbella turkmenica]|uniref:Aminoglycoside phosphotransferase family protein n=1 Tax=Kribbella turkmenica TaxID=2530375 RepID=A0A4V2YDR0_9ACTN|nr:phosphotransferase [Kribbella turkmenica]TDD16366.1 aminoglycoside phosphotransferase family protein [Kribbella turkmenica]
MATPVATIDSVVRAVCGRGVERLVPLAGGGMNETYRAELGRDVAVVVRIARQPTPWFVDEARLMTKVREVGVPTAEVLGLEHQVHNEELLSFSVQEFLPGISLAECVGAVPAAELERLVIDAGEALARVHSVAPGDDQYLRHQLRSPDEREVARVERIVAEALGPEAAVTVERGADFLRRELTTRTAPLPSLVHGDFCPKNILIHEGAVVGLIDWEFAGLSAPAYDFAQWEVDAGDPVHDRSDLVRRGYARVADPESADAGWTPGFAVGWALEKLGWKNPATPAQFRRCVDVIARHSDVLRQGGPSGGG